jgi:uncharacterized pyridoxamine 5'-phosphate oxidase family protein
MRPEQVTEVMHDPLAQELLHSAIPARMAYNGTDGFPRAIPIGFLWKDGRIVVCTASNAYKVKALAANPKVALTIDTDVQPYRALLVRGTASVEIVDGVPSEYLEASRKGLKTSSSFGRSRRRCARSTSRWRASPSRRSGRRCWISRPGYRVPWSSS